MTEETQLDRIERTINERFVHIDQRFDDLHREMDGRFKSLWREMNGKFREQKAMLRSQDNKLDTILDLLAEQEDKIVERELA
jgi:hypothetical protein